MAVKSKKEAVDKLIAAGAFPEAVREDLMSKAFDELKDLVEAIEEAPAAPAAPAAPEAPQEPQDAPAAPAPSARTRRAAPSAESVAPDLRTYRGEPVRAVQTKLVNGRMYKEVFTAVAGYLLTPDEYADALSQQ